MPTTQCKSNKSSLIRPGQVVKLSTSERLAALPRVASYQGLVCVCVLLNGWDNEGKVFDDNCFLVRMVSVSVF